MGESCQEMIERCKMDYKNNTSKNGHTEMHPQDPSHERSTEMMAEEAMRCNEMQRMWTKD